METVLVTGAGGFLGRHLCPLLLKIFRVVAVDLPGVKPISGMEWVTIEQKNDLSKVLLKFRPDIVIHAAFINQKPVDVSDYEYINDFLLVNLPLLEVMANTKAKLLLISSSAVYGHANGLKIIHEACPLSPVNIYGFIKAIQEMAAQYFTYKGLKLCILRLFNLCGPGQKRGMLLPDWVWQAVEVTQKKRDVIRVKHRKTSRDFVDVRDASRAIALVAAKFPIGEVINVASGKAVSLMDISKELERICPITLKFLEEEPDLQIDDLLVQRGSYNKLKIKYGWKPEISWQKSLRDLWNSYY